MSLEDYLAEYAKDTVVEWMRIVDLTDPDPEIPGVVSQVRATWHNAEEFSLGEFGRFRLNLSVTRIEKSKQHPCVECLTDPDEDARAWCDCGCNPDNGQCKAPCVQRAHDPNVCPNLIYVCETCNSGGHTCPGDGNSIKHGDPDCGHPDWMPATWRYVLKGDWVRLGESEAEVTASNVGEWHVDTSDYWRPKPWEHTEVKVQLKHTGKVWLPWPASSEVEILMDGTRRAAYVLQQAFPGTREVE